MSSVARTIPARITSRRMAFLLAFAALAAPISPALSMQHFRASSFSYEWSGGIIAVGIEDLDADGVLDIATLSCFYWCGMTLGVHYGIGDGYYEPRTTITTGCFTALDVGDLDEDGRADLVVDRGGTLAVMLSQGRGLFAPPDSVGIGEYPRLSDTNGDGHLDLVARLNNSTLFVWQGVGDGSFLGGSAVQIPGGIPLIDRGYFLESTFLTEDLNRDGRDDLVVPQNTAVTVRVSLGDGTFAAAQTLSLGTDRYLLLTDLDRDAISDVVCTGVHMPGLGDGTFGTPVPHDTLASASVAGDFNRDGNTDILAPSGGSVVRIQMGNGDGSFQTSRWFSAAASTLMRVADLNADGASDLISAWHTTSHGGTEHGRLNVSLSNPDAIFFTPPSLPLTAPAMQLVIEAADVDGDGYGDVVIGPWPTYGQVTHFRNLGGGQFEETATFEVEPYSEINDMAFGDIDGDGRYDLLVGYNLASTSGIKLLRNSGGVLAAPSDRQDLPDVYPRVAFGDLDGDGMDDIVAHYRSGLAVFLTTGGGAVGARVDYPGGGGYTLVADLNGDGLADILSEGLNVRLSLPGGLVGPAVYYPGGSGAFALGDIDKDGDADVVGKGFVLLGSGDGTFVAGGIAPTWGNGSGVALLDLNSDGNLDFAMTQGAAPQPASFTEGAGVVVYDGTGGGSFHRPVSYFTPALYGLSTDLAVADFDHNGALDLAVEGHQVQILQTTAHGPLAVPLSRSQEPLARLLGSNPIRGAARVALSLLGPEPVTLDLFDVAGRRLESQRIDVASPEQTVSIGQTATAQPGLYFLRVTQGALRASLRLIVAR